MEQLKGGIYLVCFLKLIVFVPNYQRKVSPRKFVIQNKKLVGQSRVGHRIVERGVRGGF